MNIDNSIFTSKSIRVLRSTIEVCQEQNQEEHNDKGDRYLYNVI